MESLTYSPLTIAGEGRKPEAVIKPALPYACQSFRV